MKRQKNRMRTLVITQNEKLLKDIKNKLSSMAYQVDEAENIPDGEYFVSIRNYDLVLCELNINGISGLSLVKLSKEISLKTSFVVLSEMTDKETNKELEIQSFKNGADDYIIIDSDFDVMMARIEAKLKFGGNQVIIVDELMITPEEEKITYQDKDIELKGKPFEVLTHLARHKEQIVSKEQLLDAIWEEPELVTPNVIEVAINQIRQKIDKPLGISTIETIRRRGYRFCFSVKS